jgi:hypothetical protein
MLVLAGCSGVRRSSPAGDGDHALTYGYGPDPKGTVVYQPDVVIVQGGPRAIRSASANGLVWTINGRAAGARDLRPGKVMFVTSRAVGRVVKIERRGNDFAVTLAPVQLTEIIRDAVIKVDAEIPADSIVYQRVPALGGLPVKQAMDFGPAGALISPAAYSPGRMRSAGLTVGEPVIRTVADDGNGLGNATDSGLPFGTKQTQKAAIGDWEVEASWITDRKSYGNFDTAKKAEKVRLRIQRTWSTKFNGGKNSAGLKTGVDVCLYGQKFRITAVVPISNGVAGPTKFVVDGIKGIDVGIWGGVANGVQDNQKIRAEVPVELNYPLAFSPLGIPLVAQAKFKFIIETAFSGRNSVLEAVAEYGIDGAFGVDNGAPITPQFSVIKPMMDSMSGITLGGSGIVFAWEARFLVGVGLPGLMSGPYAKITIAFGIAKGSALGAFLANCKGVTLKIDAAYGVGLQISGEKIEALKKFLGTDWKYEVEREVSTPVVNEQIVRPDIAICRAL